MAAPTAGSGGLRRQAAAVMLLAALLLAPWPSDPQRHQLVAAQGEASSPDQLAASEAATASEFDAFEDALSLASSLDGGKSRGSRGGTGKSSFTDADKLRSLQEGTFYIGGAPNAFPTCRAKDGNKWNASDSSRRWDCNNFVPWPRDQRDCSTCVTQAIATAMQMSVAATLQQPVGKWEVSYSSLYYCSKGGRTCQTGWDIQEALNFLIDDEPKLIRPTSCLASVKELSTTKLEPSISQWGQVCNNADTAMKACTLTNPDDHFLNCTYRSLGTFWEMQRHIRKYGAVITRVRIPSDFELQFGRNASQNDGEKLQPYRFNDTARGLYGHAVVIVGYNNTERTWTVLNSWGNNTTRPSRLGVTQDGLYRIQMGLLAIGTPDLTYGVQCVPAAGSLADLHQDRPWERASAKAVELVSPSDVLNLDASCYTYRFNSSTDSVSSIVDHFGLNMTKFVRDNQELFPDMNVTYAFVGKLQQEELQLVLDTAQIALSNSSVRPFVRCTFHGPPGDETEVSLTCTTNAADCMMGVNGNGTTGCKLVYSAANVSDALANGTTLNICGISTKPEAFFSVAHFTDVKISQRRALQAIQLAFNKNDEAVPAKYCGWASSVLEVQECDRNDWVTTVIVKDPQAKSAKKTEINLAAKIVQPLLQLHRLQSLTLYYLDGMLPPELGALANITDFYASYHCAWGELPATWLDGWGSITSLTVFPLDYPAMLSQFAGHDCGVNGSVPERWSNTEGARKLSFLDLHGNLLSGELPALSNLSALNTIFLGGNRFHGWLPRSWPETLSAIRNIDLSDNADLVGLVPREWATMAGTLNFLNIENTGLESCLPSELSGTFSMRYSGTSITGYCEQTREQRDVLERKQAEAMATTFTQLFADKARGYAVNATAEHYSGLDWYGEMFEWGTVQGLDRGDSHKVGYDPAEGYANVTLSWDKASGVVYVTNIYVEGVALDLTHLSDLASKLPGLAELFLFNCTPARGTADAGRLPSDLARRAKPALKVLRIQQSKVFGTLPGKWGTWSTLRELSLSSNILTGTLPKSWRGMRSLQQLDLSDNKISGALEPEWGRGMESLQRLDLRYNQLAGPLPLQWKGMRSLAPGLGPGGERTLDLSFNGRINGPLPALWGDSSSSAMPDGITLGFAYTRLNGTIPPSYRRFGEIDLEGTKISGCIPPGVKVKGRRPRACSNDESQAIKQLHSWLAAAYGSNAALERWFKPQEDDRAHCRNKTGIQCDADGRVTTVDLPALGLDVERAPSNLSTAELFGALGGLPELQTLAASSMRLAGPLPELPADSSGATGFGKLRAVDLSGNPNISGSLPPSWQALQALQSVDVSGCSSVSGSLPEDWAALQSLQVLRAANTGISGQLPPLFGLLLSLQELDMSNARLSGPPVPPAWVDVLHLQAAVAASGLAWAQPLLAAQAAAAASVASQAAERPAAGGAGSSVHLTRLRMLRLANNEFSGMLEPGLSRLPALQVVDLSAAPGQGNVTGALPPEWTFMSKVQELSLSGQRLSGALPPQWSTLVKLKRLSLGGNLLSGPLPSTWAGMKKLKKLDLSGNRGLNGTVPPSWVRLGWCPQVLLDGTGVTGCPSAAGDR